MSRRGGDSIRRATANLASVVLVAVLGACAVTVTPTASPSPGPATPDPVSGLPIVTTDIANARLAADPPGTELAIDGWLVDSGPFFGNCGPFVQRPPLPPGSPFDCFPNTFITDTAYQPMKVEANEARMFGTGVEVQRFAYRDFAPDPQADAGGLSIPRAGRYVVRLAVDTWAGCGERCRAWQLVRRLPLVPEAAQGSADDRDLARERGQPLELAGAGVEQHKILDADARFPVEVDARLDREDRRRRRPARHDRHLTRACAREGAVPRPEVGSAGTVTPVVAVGIIVCAERSDGLVSWHAYVGTQSAPCQANSNPASWRCTFGSSNGNQSYEWEFSVP